MILPLNSKVPEQDQNKTTLKPKFIPLSWLGLPFFLLFVMGVGILPGYLKGGQWNWFAENKPSNLAQILNVKKKGFDLPGWEIVEQNSVGIGGKDWLRQLMRRDGQTIELLILPQPYYRDRPSVEWTDLAQTNVRAANCHNQVFQLLNSPPTTIGIEANAEKTRDLLSSTSKNQVLSQVINNLPESCQNIIQVRNNQLFSTEKTRAWELKSRQKLTFTDKDGQLIEALWEQGSSLSQNVAIVNWYAWHSGGHFANSQWFWQDLKAQLKQERAGWLAVSLRIPLSANEKKESVESDAKIIAQEIHNYLMERISPSQ